MSNVCKNCGVTFAQGSLMPGYCSYSCYRKDFISDEREAVEAARKALSESVDFRPIPPFPEEEPNIYPPSPLPIIRVGVLFILLGILVRIAACTTTH